MKNTIKNPAETVNDPLMSESMSQGLNQEKQRQRLKKQNQNTGRSKQTPGNAKLPIKSGDD